MTGHARSTGRPDEERTAVVPSVNRRKWSGGYHRRDQRRPFISRVDR